jgi:hypothetical protein
MIQLRVAERDVRNRGSHVWTEDEEVVPARQIQAGCGGSGSERTCMGDEEELTEGVSSGAVVGPAVTASVRGEHAG